MNTETIHANQELRALITLLMQENLEHARHAENERMMFNSIFAAMVGVTLSISSAECTVPRIILLVFLALLNAITIALTCRWNKVFHEHTDRAMECYKKLSGLPPYGVNGDFEELNRLYMFCRRHGKLYFSTHTLFKAFNWIALIAILATLTYEIAATYLG